MKATLFLLAICLASPLLVYSQEENNIECSLCRWSTSEIENFLSSNFTETKVESSLATACSYLPEKYERLCDTTIIPLVPQIIEYLNSHETPDAICGQLHFCPTELMFDDSLTIKSRMFFTRMIISGIPMKPLIRNMILDNMEIGCY